MKLAVLSRFCSVLLLAVLPVGLFGCMSPNQTGAVNDNAGGRITGTSYSDPHSEIQEQLNDRSR